MPMNLAIRLLLAAGTALAAIAPAQAADLDEPLFIENAPEYQPVEIGNGWYLRGDIGVNFAGRHNNTYYTSGNTVFDNKIGDVISGSIGIGYQLNDWFRIDGTLERMMGSEFGATQLIAPRGPCLGWGIVADPVLGDVIQDPYPIDNCLDQDRAIYDSSNLMANAYVDLGTFMGFTPYLGAGIGISQVNWREETDNTICIPAHADAHEEGCNATGTNNQPEPNTTYTELGVVNNGTDYRLAYSLMAGVGYKASKNVTLDLGYRYFSVGGGSAFNYGPTPGSSMARDGFGTHQVKVGLRYSLW